MIPIFHQFLNPSEAQFSLNYYTNTNTQDHIWFYAYVLMHNPWADNREHNHFMFEIN